MKRYSLFDQASTLFSYVFYSLPTFWLGLILIYCLRGASCTGSRRRASSIRVRRRRRSTPRVLERGSGTDPMPNIMDIGRHLVLPVVTLVAVSIAADSRFVRSSMLDTLSQDYVRTARAKGLPRQRVVFRHAFRNALLPIITTVALEIAFLFSRCHRHRDDLLLAGHGAPVLRGRQRPGLLPAHGHPAHRVGARRAHEHRGGRASTRSPTHGSGTRMTGDGPALA